MRAIFSPVTMREIAKFLWDVSKLTATAAFITPYFTAVNIEPYVTRWMGIVAMVAFPMGLAIHFIADRRLQSS